MTDGRVLGIPLLSTGLWRSRYLRTLLAEERISLLFPGRWSLATAVLGWGCKPSGGRAFSASRRLGVPCWLLEDGFLRSVGLGVSGEGALSIVVDDLGIYYDSTRPSRLERLIAGDRSEEELSRARRLASLWQRARVTKYNHLREISLYPGKSYVLVVDQTFGDASITFGQADKESFQRMLAAALNENPGCQVLLKIHPDVHAGKKKGNIDLQAARANPRVEVLAIDAHPVGLIERADAVYVVTSQVGFEALLWGKRVRTFGMPFYAGWGLTEDELPAPDRRKRVPLENLVHAALVDYPRYIDPETSGRCVPERVIEWMGLQRKLRERFPERLWAVGFSDWKKPIVRDFLQGSEIEFVDSLDRVPAGEAVVGWGLKSFGELGERQGIRIEDGFLRSVGLGAELIRPLSWVIDSRGIYYDATRPSDLEHLLQKHDFDDALLARSAALRARIVASGLTKYNVGSGGWQRPVWARRVILVPGQVESDASIAFGAPEGVCRVRRNMDLLRAVREENPDAYVVYKPHPDVLAGLRARGLDEDSALAWCDEQVIDIPMNEMLDKVDEVHVITSLAGFEALLRGKRVTCHGQPFYSGWGLTEDKVPVPRRTRQLPLDALVAGALILYPTYVSRTTRRFTTPERALDELLMWREQGAGKVSLWRRVKRAVLGLRRS